MADNEEHAGAETGIAAIRAMIREHDASDETSLSDAQVAAISALIAAAAADQHHGTTTTTITGIVGSVLDDYDEFRNLSSGSAGAVTKARHRATGQTVALKSLHGYSGGSVRDLLREACFMAACPAHPSLVALRGMARSTETDTDGYCLVMDCVDGPTLHDCIRMGRPRPFPEAHARRVMRQLLSAAAHMHAHGVIHRDIKPENILVDFHRCIVKICDFGSALYEEHDAEECYAAGTRPYSAPEMLLERPGGYGALVDAWSLGCVMAELLTGEALFNGGCDSDALYEIFDLLGVPGKRAWKPYEASFVADRVPLWRRAQQQQRRHCNRLGELFPEELLSRDGFQVLKGLLTCDPNKRLPAADALQLPWFAAHDDCCEASFDLLPPILLPPILNCCPTGGSS